jgi:ATP synthase subunit 6
MFNKLWVYYAASPLEQFSIENFFILGCWTPVTNSAMAILLPTCIFLLACSYFKQGGSLVSKFWPQALIELIYEFVYNLVQEQVGKKGLPYFPFVFSLFSFLLVTNLFGILPITFTSTSHFIITFGLSVSVFIGVTVIGFQTHGLHFFSFLLPPGAPLILAPFLVVLELVSYSFRAISLGVRLFANMMAGHTLVHILCGFSWEILIAGGFILKCASLVPMAVVIALIGLEIGVAILQAYVFTILTCIYINDAIHLH